tara:strand:+ start:545 stop:1549 length:1005 start_codon:yes stop_codon:yes gene_type:complete
VQRVGNDTAIPLNTNAPQANDSIWGENAIIELDVTDKKARYYWEHISNEIRTEFGDEFPQAFEIQGDVLLVKIPDEMVVVEHDIARAMLEQFPSVRVVCHDDGVAGEFRVRNLRVLKARNDNDSTLTRYREHGHEFDINPAVAYFSGRLGTQRMRTLDATSSMAKSKGRPLVVVDPYAGVGPSMALLYTDANLVSKAYVNDMNPDAIPLLKQNMEYFHSKRKQDGTYVVDCMDARALMRSRPELIGTADVLLVNIPHESIDHLPDLLPLLSEDESLVCGWSIQAKQADIEHQLRTVVEVSDWTITTIHVEEIKGFSTAKAMFRYELVLSNQNKR